jgi:hypothetical protein
MNAVVEKTIYQLTHVNDLSDVSVDDLLQLVNEHPYFAPAQLALAARFKADNDSHYTGQLQKTALYFNNITWLSYLLQDRGLEEVDTVIKKIRSADGQTAAVSGKEEPVVSPVAGPGVIPVEGRVASAVISPAVIPGVTSPAPVIPASPEAPAVPPLSPVTPVTPPAAFTIPTVEKVREIMQGITAPTFTSYENTEPVAETTAGKEEHNRFPRNESIIPSSLSNQLADFKKNFNKPVQQDMKLDFEMEPYYTIDYFASQGIKADLTQLPYDKLTRQLLTFTDWLKKMKAISPDPQDLGTDPELENAVQGIAQTSNEAKEIATETMAEVFVKQGKIDKAVQLYIKLSFLDPGKSSYFAAKIQQLKGI